MFKTKKRFEDTCWELNAKIQSEKEYCNKYRAARQREVDAIKDDCEKKISEKTKDIDEVIGNFSRLSLVHDHESRRWRIVVELDSMMMSEALERGNDRDLISYIGESIKRQAMQEIMSCNIQRPESLGLGRQRFPGFNEPVLKY